MFYRSLRVAIIFLISWLAYTSAQSSRQLSLQISGVQQAVAEKSTTYNDLQLENNKGIDEIQTFIKRQDRHVAEQKRLESELAKQRKLTNVYNSYSTVLNAEILRLNEQYSDAANLLNGAKKGIWKSGDVYKNRQKDLRGLMPKIDGLVSAWKGGNGSGSAKVIYKKLDQIIQEQGK